MNATNSKNESVNEKLAQFFKNEVKPDQLAKVIRRLNHSVTTLVLQNDNEAIPLLNKDWIKNGFYWLNEFAEILEPYLEIE